MAKSIEIIVTPKNGDHIGWFVHLWSWNAEKKDIIQHRLKQKSEGGGKVTLESEATFPSGEYWVTLHVLEAGNSASLEVAGNPQIIFPFGSAWPMQVGHAIAVQDSANWLFRHNG